MSELRFDNRAVVVTGAANGLGRSHALQFAARGARVVVNDPGAAPTGEGSDRSAATRGVDEIVAAGGEAVASHDSVTDGARIVQCALDNFGRLDVLVNNAGILRDRSFHKMTEEDWDRVYDVHVKGAFRVTRAAWPHMRGQDYGRVLFTASAAGLYGNFGQANYAMAKLGLHGLAQTLAIEGARHNIVVNTIAPVARSRLTDSLLPPQLLEQLRPELVSPLVLKLCHEDHSDNGGLYEAGGGWMARLRWQRSYGHDFSIDRPLTPEDVAQQWSRITTFENAEHPRDGQEALMRIMGNPGGSSSK